MRDFKKERGTARRLLKAAMGIVMLGALAVLSFVAARAAWDMYGKFSEASAADAATQGELKGLRVQYAAASATVQRLGTQEGVDAAVRERYGLARPGEGEIDIVEGTASSSIAAPRSQGFWAVLGAFFSWF